MNIFITVLTCLAGLIAVLWISRHILIILESKYGFLLQEDYAGPPDPAPRISVVIAAKDEEANIENCLRTMLDQDYPNFEVIACNDRSDDATGEIIDRLASEYDNLTALHIAELPEGWMGKNHAMQKGTEIATGEYLLFTDADCHQTSRRTLSVSLQYFLDRGRGMLSLLPMLEMKGFWENVIQPVCSGVMMIWFDPRRVNNPKRSAAYANGAFILVSREAYDEIGQHKAVANVMQEDMELGRLAKEGPGLAVSRSSGLYTVRMYTTLRQIVRGWTRIFYGCFHSIPKIVISFILMLLMAVVPYTAAAVGWTLWAKGAQPQNWLFVCGILGCAGALLQLTVIYRFYSLIKVRKELFWTYLFGSLIVLWILILGLLKHLPGSTLTWRGTKYKGQ